MLSSLKSLTQLIYPPHCLICSEAGDHLCQLCIRNWEQTIKVSKINSLPQFFTKYYNSDGMKVILAAKESGNSIARNLLATSIANSLTHAIQNLKLQDEVTLITIPSRSSAIRKRGRDHIKELAAEIISQRGQNFFQ